MRLKRFCLPALFFLIPVLCPSDGNAHLLRFSSSEMHINGSQVSWLIQVHLQDFQRKASDFEAGYLDDYLSRRLRVTTDEGICSLVKAKVDIDTLHENVAIPLSFTCPHTVHTLHVVYHLFFGDLQHQHLLQVYQDHQMKSFTLSMWHPEADFDLGDSVWNSMVSFIRLGFEHILFGIDHLLFVFSLLLGVCALRPLLLVITTFTIAHSLTLALAVFDLLVLPTSIVEPLIAVTIVGIAALHFTKKDAAKSIRWYVFLTFFFGLIHGLGFSSVLRASHLEPHHVLVPLVSFNVGVELGQLTFILAVFPCMLILQKKFPALFEKYVKVSLLVVIGVALYWFFQRAVFPG